MLKSILFSLAMITSFAVNAQSTMSDYDVSKDKENGAVVFKGQCSFEDLKKESSFSWLTKGAAAYKPDTNAIAYLKKHLPDYQMVVFMGTWCDDSQNLIPKLYKTMQLAGYPMAKYAMFGVDRAKETKNIEHKLYSISKVPTIILFRHNSEIGRIVENVRRSIEVDLVQVIQKDPEVQEANK